MTKRLTSHLRGGTTELVLKLRKDSRFGSFRKTLGFFKRFAVKRMLVVVYFLAVYPWPATTSTTSVLGSEPHICGSISARRSRISETFRLPNLKLTDQAPTWQRNVVHRGLRSLRVEFDR